MKKLVRIVLCLSIVLLITGCSSKKKEEKKEKSKGKCEVLDCINLIEVTDNLETVNEKLGLEGKIVKDTTTTYKWKLTSTENVEITFNETSNDVKIKFLDEKIKNNKVKFTKYDKLAEQLKAGETVTIDDLNKSFKGKGTLIEKSSTILKYRWVDKEEGYLEASINAVSGKCIKINGMI